MKTKPRKKGRKTESWVKRRKGHKVTYNAPTYIQPFIIVRDISTNYFAVKCVLSQKVNSATNPLWQTQGGVCASMIAWMDGWMDALDPTREESGKEYQTG